MSMVFFEYDWSIQRIETESSRERMVRKMAGSDWVRSTNESAGIRRKHQERKVRK